MSLGAERPRLIRQLLGESALLGFVGAVLGVALAWSANRLLLAMVSTGSEPVPIRVTPDTGVLGFTVALTILTVLLFGTAPALRATGLDLAPSLQAGRGVVSTALRNRLARGLVVGQVALSLVLLAGAGLLLRSLANVLEVDVGFDKQNVLRMRIDPVAAGYQRDERLSSLMRSLEDRVGSLPGIRGASFALSVFDGGGWSGDDITVPGRARSERDPSVDLNIVGPQYFAVMKMPMILGRALSPRDSGASRSLSSMKPWRIHFSPAPHPWATRSMLERIPSGRTSRWSGWSRMRETWRWKRSRCRRPSFHTRNTVSTSSPISLYVMWAIQPRWFPLSGEVSVSRSESPGERCREACADG